MLALKYAGYILGLFLLLRGLDLWIVSPAGGTTVSFEYAWQSAPALERVAAPLIRALMRRVLGTTMERLRDTLAAQQPATAPRGG